MISQKVLDNGDNNQSTQSRLVKLLASSNAASQIAGFKQQSQEKAKSSRSTKPKAQNSSSMEQRRGSHSFKPPSRGNSTKKAKNQAIMLVTDNQELIEAAQQHMPRINLSTTNKTTRDINLNLLDQRSVIGSQQAK